MIALMKRLWSDESGLSVLEYAIGAAALVGIVAAAMTALGGKLQSLFNSL